MNTGLFDKNGTPIKVGDRTRLVLDDGEVREFEVIRNVLKVDFAECSGCKNDGIECDHCMRAYSDCYEN